MDDEALTYFQTWHELAQPFLYTSITVNDLPLFLSHLDNAPPSISAKFTSKRARLLTVKALRLVGLPTPCGLEWRVHDLLEATNANWEVLESGAAQITRYLTQGVKNRKGLVQLLQTNTYHGIMPNVDTITTGQFNACSWNHIMDLDNARSVYCAHDARTMASAALRLTDWVLSLGPKHVCIHNKHGPFVLSDGNLPAAVSNTIFTTHHHNKFNTRAALFLGAINRHIIPPGDMYEYDGPGYRDLVERDDHELLQHNPYSVRPYIQTMKLDYYGFFEPLPAPEAPGATVWLSNRQKRSFEHYRDVCGQEQKEVEAANRLEWTKNFEANAETIWRRKFAFKPYSKVPKCEGCGWSKDEGHMIG